jgi:hypothetical protein
LWNFLVTIPRCLIASATVCAAATACTQDAVQANTDCASLLAQYDQATAVASAEHVSTAAAARDEGHDLCLEGRTVDGSAKLIEAISQISAGVDGVSNSRR